LASFYGMILTHTDQAVALRVNDVISIAILLRWCDGLRLLTWNETIDALIGKVGEVDNPVAHGIVTAAVFMDASANIKRGRCHICFLPVRCTAYKHTTPTLSRTSLSP